MIREAGEVVRDESVRGFARGLTGLGLDEWVRIRRNARSSRWLGGGPCAEMLMSQQVSVLSAYCGWSA